MIRIETPVMTLERKHDGQGNDFVPFLIYAISEIVAKVEEQGKGDPYAEQFRSKLVSELLAAVQVRVAS